MIGVEGDEVWERMRQRHQRRCALAGECEDTWDARPEGAVRWWSMNEEPAYCQVSSSQAAASVNVHPFQSTAQPQAQAGKSNSCQEAREPGVTQEHTRFIIAGLAWHREEVYN